MQLTCFQIVIDDVMDTSLDQRETLDIGGWMARIDRFILTRASFMGERVYQIAEGCINDTMEYFLFHYDKASSSQGNLQPKCFMAGIYYFPICGHTK